MENVLTLEKIAAKQTTKRIERKTANRAGGASPKVLVPIVILLGIVGVSLYFYFRKPNDNPDSTKLTAQQAQQYVKLASQAVQHLENEDFRSGFENAERILLQLREALPDDPFSLQNLVVLNVLRYEKTRKQLKEDEAKHDAYVEATFDLIDEFLEQEAESYVSYMLAYRFRAAVAGQIDETDVELLTNACKYAGDEVAPYAEFYLATSILKENHYPGITEQRNARLADAYQRQKDNLKLAMDYLIVLAKNESSEFQNVWKDFQESLAPVILGFDSLELVDTRKKLIDKVQTAFDSGDWKEAHTNLVFLWNLTKKFAVQKIDLARIELHLLEFMKPSLNEEIVSLAKREATKDQEVLDVAFQSHPVISDSRQAIAVKSLDFDLDKELEIAILFTDSLEVFKRPNGDDLKTWNQVARIELTGEFDQLLVGDLDYDTQSKAKDDSNPEDIDKEKTTEGARLYGDPDFVLIGKSGVQVLINRVDGEKNRKIELSENTEFAEIKNVTAGTLVDIDHDRDLDFLVATDQGIQLFISRGREEEVSFYDFSNFSSFPSSSEIVSGFDIVDLDRDIDIDVLVSFENRRPGYLENLNHSRLRFQELDGSFKALNGCKFLIAAEIDGHPSWDLVGVGPNLITLNNSRQLTKGLKRKTSQSNLGNGRSVLQADFNNDRFTDCLVFGGDQSAQLVLGTGRQFGDPKSLQWKLKQCDLDDLDVDGKVDLVAIQNGQAVILQNVSESAKNWCEIHICGITSNFAKGRVNNHGVGSFLETKIGDRYCATTAKKSRIHFGLGDQNQVDLIRILWTSGMPQSRLNVKTGAVLYEEMFEKGSCPYLYTWNGTEYEYFGDCLWAAPLGLQYARGEYVPCRNWEYLKIPGRMLQPIDGEYRMQLTEELREATYFDQVELFAVDHPEGIDIFTNDKVGPPFIAEHKILTVANRHYPVSAVDKTGTNVRDKILRRDGDYFKGFDQRLSKGLAPTHYLELDLGKLKSTEGLTLFLNGWIRPTDSSLNIAISQNPELKNPVPPVILVPDENGKWVKTVDPMGFPGGKAKTIAVDLTKAFLTTDYRLRIETSHEIYWDEVFFTQGENPAEFKQTQLKLKGADLHYRGFSKRFVPDENSPEWYDYSQVTEAPRWPPMTGNFTRFGEVSSLLTKVDDRSAVLGAGDEMTVRFAAIPDPPAGWKRDFVIHLVGYDKDGDLNTMTGQSSEPLPFDAMKSYPFDDASASSDLKEYVEQYQTRPQPRTFWKELQLVD